MIIISKLSLGLDCNYGILDVPYKLDELSRLYRRNRPCLIPRSDIVLNPYLKLINDFDSVNLMWMRLVIPSI